MTEQPANRPARALNSNPGMHLAISMTKLTVLGIILAGCGDKQSPPEQPQASVKASEPTPSLTKLERLKKSADGGDASAMFELSEMYFDGKEVEKNNTLGESYLAMAAAAKHPQAVFELGDSLYGKLVLAWTIDGDTPENKFANAQKLFKESERLFLEAGELGASDAHKSLGFLYLDGLTGVSKHLGLSASKIPKEYAENVDKALLSFEKSAESGSPKSMVVMYRLHSLPKYKHVDAEKATGWFKKISALSKPSDLGVAADALFYGVVASGGGFTPIDGFRPEPAWLKEAQPLLERASDLGDSNSHVLLAKIYLEGLGTQKNLSIAAKYLEKAAAGNNTWSQITLGKLYMSGTGVFQDYAAAWKLFTKAAISPDLNLEGWEAQYLLGVLLEKGLGVTKDLVLAHAWYNIAATNGYEKATSRRVAVTSQLNAEELTEAQALAKGWKAGLELTRSNVSSSPGVTPGVGSGQRKTGTGTMFYVNADGMAITNSHVVAGCKEVKVEGNTEAATVVTQDAVNDLALVKVAGAPKQFARVVADPAKTRQGEEIVVFGYPLNSVLSSGGNLTPGVVSALTGLGNNTNQLQITAAIQPGSSGSPVLNSKGSVVGVVSMKLSDAAMAKTTGQIAQNVNFAVNGQTLKSFLDAHKVTYSSGSGIVPWDKSKADLADDARKWTTVLECWK
jgi:TPR repeat protein